MLAPSLTLTNEGDGVDGHPVPVPQICIYLTFVAGRGGMLDYMTYNTRIDTLTDLMHWTVLKRGRQLS